MITERTLKKWRKEALKTKSIEELIPKISSSEISEMAERILRMSQELLDQHLIRRN